MFKFTVLNFAGNTTLTNKTEEKIREYMTDRARVFGEQPYSTEAIEIPAAWLLMIFHGWQGGTIHQVAKETELTVEEILNLDSVQPKASKLDGMSDYYMGYHAGHLKVDLKLVADKVQYWRGVCEHVCQYRLPNIMDMHLANK